jgi:hypothetical protein
LLNERFTGNPEMSKQTNERNSGGGGGGGGNAFVGVW